MVHHYSTEELYGESAPDDGKCAVCKKLYNCLEEGTDGSGFGVEGDICDVCYEKFVESKKNVMNNMSEQKSEQKLVFIGIVDDWGLESFIPMDKDNQTSLYMRAACNGQRHAKVYRVEVTAEQKSIMDSMIDGAKKVKGRAGWVKAKNLLMTLNPVFT